MAGEIIVRKTDTIELTSTGLGEEEGQRMSMRCKDPHPYTASNLCKMIKTLLGRQNMGNLGNDLSVENTQEASPHKLLKWPKTPILVLNISTTSSFSIVNDYKSYSHF